MVLQSQPQYNYDSQVIKIKNRLIGSVSFVMFKFKPNTNPVKNLKFIFTDRVRFKIIFLLILQLNRTISDVPMKSKLGQTKISPNAKASTLVNYTKHQEKAQNRKVNSLFIIKQSKTSFIF